MPLTSKQRKYLRSQAHHLKPIVLIGRLALNESILKSINQSLNHHELIKIKFNDHKSSKDNLIENINQSLSSETVGMIGNIAIIYRQNKEIDKRRYQLD
tara:strand:- start:144 stop:440 length:297 start_codon:yes stop_codon:yes gene_type:complete